MPSESVSSNDRLCGRILTFSLALAIIVANLDCGENGVVSRVSEETKTGVGDCDDDRDGTPGCVNSGVSG